MSSVSAPASTTATPAVLPLNTALLWLGFALTFALGVYYFLAVDQGAYSIMGSDAHVHEFVHDARHFLGFPCH